jgi:YVTN family beta-propeller protein
MNPACVSLDAGPWQATLAVAVTEFRILGSLEVHENGHSVDVGGGKQRALLALLLIRPGQAVSTDALIDALWGAHPPRRAESSMHAYVSRLRRVLGRDRLLRSSHGYRLVVEPEELDATRFEGLLASGRACLERGDAEEAAETLRAALALWQGPPLADFTYEAFAADEIARLQELRLQAVEARIEAELTLGRHQQLVPELDDLVRKHPLRERLRGQQLLALYRCGRQADALEAYRQLRSTLVAELGLEPGPALQQLEREILTHDAALDIPREGRGPATWRPTRRAAMLAAAAALPVLTALALVIAFTRGDGSSGPVVAGPNTVAVIDSKTNRLVARVPVGEHPVGIAYRGGDVWVANTNSNTLSRIDPETRGVETIGLGAPPTDVVFAGGSVWTGNGSDGTLSEISPVLGKVVGEIDLAGRTALIRNSVNALAGGGGSLWAAMSEGHVLRIDPRTHEKISIDVPSTPLAITYGAGAAWAVTSDNHLVRIEANSISGEQLVGYPGWNAVTVAGGHVVAGVQPSLSMQSVEMLDADSMLPEWSSRMSAPVAVAVGAGAVWVGSLNKKVYRLDPTSGKVTGAIDVGGVPHGLAVVEDEVWVTLDRPE